MRAESWQTAEVPGPIKAILVSEPKKVAELLKSSSNPVLFLGFQIMDLSSEGFDPMDIVGEISETTKARLVTSSKQVLAELRKRDLKDSHILPPIELADRLSDPNWEGIDGGGQHDLAIFVGMPYYFEWLILSRLKHFAYRHLKTLTLDPYYHPNASRSLPNLPPNRWRKFMEELASTLRGG